MNKEEIANVCTFTGRRPEKLKADQDKVKEWLKEQIQKSVEEGYTDFITGMARGVELWAAEEVLRLKKEGAKLRHIAAVPFKNVDRDWDKDWKERFKYVLENSDEVHYVSAVARRKAFIDRNIWMVDRAAKLIAVFTGALGGTKQTLDYAKKLKRKIVKFENS